ncbi:MAG: hypothetical protein C4306_00465 [Thermoleophilia bacterium]
MRALRRLVRGEASPLALFRLSLATLAALFLVVTSGAFVRLTGSGLGCENWPRCGDKPYPEQGFHAFVEFGNRLVALVGIALTLLAWLALRRAPGASAVARRSALGAFLGAAGQIPLGGVTVILELHPLAVMAHFLLALVVVGLALVVALETWGQARGWHRLSLSPLTVRLATWAGLPLLAALVVTGAVATAAGPHSGSDRATVRLGLTVTDAVWLHVRMAAVAGVAVLLLGFPLLRRRRQLPGIVCLWAGLVAALVAQAALGEVQYRNALPWGLVLGHVFLAATIWTLGMAVAYALRRAPAPLGGKAAARQAAPREGLMEPASQKVP